MSIEKQIENAINTTLVVENRGSIKYAVTQIKELFDSLEAVRSFERGEISAEELKSKEIKFSAPIKVSPSH
jgi:hypothetical protein